MFYEADLNSPENTLASVNTEMEAKMKKNTGLYWGVSGLQLAEHRLRSDQKNVLLTWGKRGVLTTTREGVIS